MYLRDEILKLTPDHFTEVRFASFFSGGFTTMAVINPLERKLTKPTSVHLLLMTIISGFGDAVVYLFAACFILQGS